MRIRPLRDRVLVKRLDTEHKTVSGIVPGVGSRKAGSGQSHRYRRRESAVRRHASSARCENRHKVLFGLPVTALAADKLDIGKMEYEGACAVCHGYMGKGDGFMKSQLVSRVPDLTVLAKNNNGVFPFDRVYQIIDGRQEVKAHGSREMPIWGRHFNMQDSYTLNIALLMTPNQPLAAASLR